MLLWVIGMEIKYAFNCIRLHSFFQNKVGKFCPAALESYLQCSIYYLLGTRAKNGKFLTLIWFLLLLFKAASFNLLVLEMFQTADFVKKLLRGMNLTYLHLLSFTSLTYILGWFQEEKYLPANAIHTLFCRL